MEMNPCPMDRLDPNELAKYLEGYRLAPETVCVFKEEHISGEVFMRHLDEETLVKLNLPLGERKLISHLITKERIGEKRSRPSLKDISSGPVEFAKAFQAMGIEEKTIRTLENENFIDNLHLLERSDIDSCPKADLKIVHHLHTEHMSTNSLVHDFIRCTPVKVREWKPKEVERFLKTLLGRSWPLPTVFQNMTGEELVNLDKDSYKSQLRDDEFITMSIALYYLHESIKESGNGEPIDLHSKRIQNTTKKTIESPTSDDAEIQIQIQFFGFETSQPETSQPFSIPSCHAETNLQAPHEFDKPLAKHFKYTKGHQFDRYESNRGSPLHRIHEFNISSVDRKWERPLTDREFCEKMLYEDTTKKTIPNFETSQPGTSQLFSIPSCPVESNIIPNELVSVEDCPRSPDVFTDIQMRADQEFSGFETSQPETSQRFNIPSCHVESNIIPTILMCPPNPNANTLGYSGQCSTETNLQAPHEFDKPLAKDFKYVKGRQFDRYESNRGSLLHRIHEFKLFAVDRKRERPLTVKEFGENMLYEVLPFASACLNSRQNGTIYFGIVDEIKENANTVGYTPREVVGVKSSHDTFQQELLSYSMKCLDRFILRHREAAQQCIRGPRIIPVFNEDGTFTERYVIEYDINPHHQYTRRKIFKVEPPSNTSSKKRGWTKREAFYRDYDQGIPATKRIPDGLKYYEETGGALDDHRKFLERNNGSGKPDEKYTPKSSFLAASDGNGPTPGYTPDNEVEVTQTASTVYQVVSDEAVNNSTDIDQASRCTSAVPEWLEQGANNTMPQLDPLSDDERAQVTPSILDKTTRDVADHSPATGQTTGDEFKASQSQFDQLIDQLRNLALGISEVQ